MNQVRGPADVEAALRSAGVAYQRFEVAAGAHADEAARSLGVSLGAIVKTLVFLADGRAVLVLVAGDRRANTQRLKQVLGAQQVKIAPPERVLAETGYPVGAVPPVGLLASLPVWIDAALAAHPTVYASGGAVDVLVGFSFADLLRASGGQLVDVVEEG